MQDERRGELQYGASHHAQAIKSIAVIGAKLSVDRRRISECRRTVKGALFTCGRDQHG